MKANRLLFLSLLLFVAALYGCKEDEEDKLYLSGSIVIPIDKYVEAGYTKSFHVDTLLHATLDDGTTDGIGYALVLPGSSRDTIKTKDGDFTQKTFIVEAPDSLDTFSVSVVAFADGYYESAVSSSFTVVKQGINGKRTTLTGYDIKDEEAKFTDERDGREYYYAVNGELQWMKQNLSWEGAGIAYEKCTGSAVSSVFGQYYSWSQAQTACPEGWRLPTDKDWCELASSCGLDAVEGKDISGFSGMIMENVYFNRAKMWEYWRDVKITNSTGLSAAPFGYATVDEDSYLFSGKDKYAVFWCADDVDDLGVNRYIFDEKNILFYGTADKDYFAASVRCVRDVPTL